MRNVVLLELLSIVLRFIESDDSLDSPFLENVAVLIRSEAGPLAWFALVNRAHEGRKLARDDPVDVSVVHPLVILILLHVEGLEVIPVVLDRLLKSLQAVKDRALIVTLPLRGVSEWHYL